MSKKDFLTRRHSFFNEQLFQIKASLLILRRIMHHAIAGTKPASFNQALVDAPVLASSSSALWNPDDNPQNWHLTAGKVQNLRVAATYLNGLEIKAHQVFSFWQQIGRPSVQKGYVVGREIREGCLVPSVAGGICQLSNALYDAALRAQFQIIERYRHSQVIKGSLAEIDRDATVKWNYIDLRFSAPFDFRIEVTLSADELRVVLKAQPKEPPASVLKATLHTATSLNDCYSCNNIRCLKHVPPRQIPAHTAITTYILDQRWVEFDDYIQTQAQANDVFIVPFKWAWLRRKARFAWSMAQNPRSYSTLYASLRRAFLLRYHKDANPFALTLEAEQGIAQSASRLIPIESTHLVIAQNLLPFLQQSGALGGRTWDVLMTRLPFDQLHQRLDAAQQQHPHSPTLTDFRAPATLVSHERQALAQARSLISPHPMINALFAHRAQPLTWHLPRVHIHKAHTAHKILFPASALARKGAYAVKRLAEELNLSIVLYQGAVESADFWGTITTEYFSGDYQSIALLVYPAYIEHEPRSILTAIAHGIPCIISDACGIAPTAQVCVIPADDYASFKQHVIRALQTQHATD